MRAPTITALLGIGIGLSACGGGGSSPTALTLNSGLEVCGLSCPEDVVEEDDTSNVGQLPTAPPTQNSGNETELSIGDDTIALEKSILISDKNKLSKSRLTSVQGSTATLAIDTQTNRNSFWPKPKVMEYYKFGSENNEIDVSGDGSPAPGGQGLGGTYEEYRMLTSSQNNGTAIDEELQIWRWQHSYGTQYRDVTSGGPDADHQAWSFGGTRTTMAAMPTTGAATYRGQFGSTSKTSGWVNTNDQRQTLSYNNDWQVQGDSVVNANFGTNQVNATLSPTKWRAYQTMNGATGFLTVDLATIDRSEPNFIGFMESQINLKGTITKDAVTGNSVRGSATMDSNDGWISNSSLNPFAGAFFGPTANEFTGIFNVEATNPAPIGGYFPINGDRRGNIQHGGVVNAQQ